MWTEKMIEDKTFSENRQVTIQDIEQMKLDGWKVNIFKHNRYKYRDDLFTMDGFINDTIHLEPVQK